MAADAAEGFGIGDLPFSPEMSDVLLAIIARQVRKNRMLNERPLCPESRRTQQSVRRPDRLVRS
jgi:hypothetical protein